MVVKRYENPLRPRQEEGIIEFAGMPRSGKTTHAKAISAGRVLIDDRDLAPRVAARATTPLRYSLELHCATVFEVVNALRASKKPVVNRGLTDTFAWLLLAQQEGHNIREEWLAVRYALEQLPITTVYVNIVTPAISLERHAASGEHIGADDYGMRPDVLERLYHIYRGDKFLNVVGGMCHEMIVSEAAPGE